MTWPLRALRWSYCAFIAWASLQTFLFGRSSHDVHALVLSSIELLAIAAFLFEKIERPAGAVLIGVYAIAAVLTSLEGEVPLRFVYFAATAFYIAYSPRERPQL